MNDRRFYQLTFALLFSLNILVYCIKSGESLVKSIAFSGLAFLGAFGFALIVFRRLGWSRQKVSK